MRIKNKRIKETPFPNMLLFIFLLMVVSLGCHFYFTVCQPKQRQQDPVEETETKAFIYQEIEKRKAALSKAKDTETKTATNEI